MNINDTVRIKSIEEVKNDVHLEEVALAIIEKSDFTGVITKIMDNVYFVGFKNDLGWVTQGYYEDEIEVI